MKNITNDYKKSNVAVVNKIDKKDKELTEKLEIDNRVYRMNCSEAFITIKDHKDNFRNNTKCRLINTAKYRTLESSTQLLNWMRRYRLMRLPARRTNMLNH